MLALRCTRFAAGVRGNARGADLNRDFPDPFERGPAGVVRPSGTEQPETRAVMDWIRSGRFVSSASLHEVRHCLLSFAMAAYAGGLRPAEADRLARMC